MASAFGHAALACTLGTFRKREDRSLKFWFWMVVFSIIPDADVLAFRLGIPYEHMLGHRGFTHSILFAALSGLIVTLLFFREQLTSFTRWGKTALALFICMLSHGILDALTTGGKGVGFWIPFSGERYFFPFHPIKVSPLSPSQFFSQKGLMILYSEGVWIGGACVILLVLKFVMSIWQQKSKA